MLCCLELGIALLHGGDDNFQYCSAIAGTERAVRTFEQAGAPELFAALLSRLRRAAIEARYAPTPCGMLPTPVAAYPAEY
eukprot:1374759-Rhodomonas_salina.2